MVVADKELKARSLLDVNPRQGATNAFRNHPEGGRLFKTGSQWVGCYVL